MDSTVMQLWTPVGIILGFQMSLFSWRLAEENKEKNKENGKPWLVPADIVNFIAILILSIGCYVYPILFHSSKIVPLFACGLGIVLFVGYIFTLAGHYQLYTIGKKPSVWFPRQEKIAVITTVLISATYIVSFINNNA